MPGSVRAITGTLDTYPLSTFTSFVCGYTRETAFVEYSDGSSQRKSKSEAFRRRWRISHRLTASQLSSLRTFWKAHLDTPFNFTDHPLNLPVMAIFSGGWSEEWQLGKYLVSLELTEVL